MRPYPVACPRNNLWKRKLDRGCTVSLHFFFYWCFHLYFLCLRVSSKASSLLHFGFGVACMLSYRCLQMKWRVAVIVFAIPSQPALLISPYVSAAKLSILLPKASRTFLHSRHPADCILPIVATWLAGGVILSPATAIPRRLLCLHGICLSLKHLPCVNFPACCLSIKSATHVP